MKIIYENVEAYFGISPNIFSEFLYGQLSQTFAAKRWHYKELTYVKPIRILTEKYITDYYGVILNDERPVFFG